jgi:hypothetical protein
LPLVAPITDDPELDRITQAELNAIHQHGSVTRPQWEVHGIGLPGTGAQPTRGRQEVAESEAGEFTDVLLQFELSKSLFPSNVTNPITDSDELILSKVRQNQATARQAMVARHAKNHNLPSYKEGDVVKQQLLERFCKLSCKLFVICQVKSGPHRGSFKLLCEYGVLNQRYPASRSSTSLPFFGQTTLSVSPVAKYQSVR